MEASSPLVLAVLHFSLLFDSFVAVDPLKDRSIWNRLQHCPLTSGSCLASNAVCLDRDSGPLARPAASARF